jgi:DnaK suppressor protein
MVPGLLGGRMKKELEMKTIEPTKSAPRAASAAKGLRGPKELLLAARSQLLSGFGDKVDTLKRPENAAIEDLAPVFHDQFVASLLNRLEFERLQLVNEAIGRLNDGSYGKCADCDEVIAQRRLQAIPWAVRCVACQELWSAARQADGFDEELAA